MDQLLEPAVVTDGREGWLSMDRLPDFIIIGAMKCATSTLHDQLALQPGLLMSDPKEPNFFSNDEQYGRGLDWYAGLFAAADDSDLCGESSTHYTKLPTYPQTVERMHGHVPGARLIYVMRHPLERLVSQYIHEWTERAVPSPIGRAVRECPRLTEYSLYAMQLRPYFDAFGVSNVLPVFSERLRAEPQAELERVCRFIGYSRQPHWQRDLASRNVSAQRLRKSTAHDALVWNPAATWLRRRFVPQAWRDRVKRLWQMKERPRLSEDLAARLKERLDADLSVLGGWLGVDLDCDGFREVVVSRPLEFVGADVGAHP